MPNPDWAYLGIPPIDYQDIQYYSVPKTKKKLGSLDEADPELLATFEKLEAVENYPNLIQTYLGSVVPSGDNFFGALNSAVFSDGSFCYIPKDIICPMELSTYFRINNEEAGQFERTLIVAEERSQVSYLEGCTAPQFSSNQLHAAVVELIALDDAIIKYSTVQNWYSGDENGVGGALRSRGNILAVY
eukprot:scaffold323957_cov468-Tisochrysis_lutea.AAC.1